MHQSLYLDRLAVPGFARVEVVETSPSTNTELAAAVRADPAAWPAPSALVAEHQTAGRGRAGRSWETPARAGLTVSVLLRPRVPPGALGWLPLLAGLAVVRTVSDGGVTAAVKWPNDVLLPAVDTVAGLGLYRKVAGILAEVVPAADGTEPSAVVLGIGLNVSQSAQELPVPTATSLALAGYPRPDRTDVLVRLLGEVHAVVRRWERADGDAAAAGLLAEYTAVSATLGTRVRAELAGGAGVVEGEAVGLDGSGALVVRQDAGPAAGQERTVTAGDVWHLR
ncbi:biotin--[acetyl-CoA-carboxylase] ligase [Promicromonospora thailandica]|uniref:biotin--[biotin carboxyl-carrier protein] ligase n=1 Tax=Promicromonospora thailandica TaxID=765201 RepID=A0A9X2FZL2_9MICO|nr:biotin--[acetyl-CoA-carboxylase] ligase [Promicromonospora thailandica]MCP2262973.1 BirA family transcriptional regulator, biotin operon repressor / biotin-[acetyl-CoA-carboxylase] ligase [Promicromonospora thailandica]BFF18336.1 biotin--[acetyl-CoA-carboxylase] ligase [Promicromonospora thailandica]